MRLASAATGSKQLFVFCTGQEVLADGTGLLSHVIFADLDQPFKR